jgi:hypothetical protein
MLYEMWVLVEIHSLLVDAFGFEAVGTTPIELADVVDLEAVLPKKSIFTLRFQPKNSTSSLDVIDLTIHYNPALQPPPCKAGKACFSLNQCLNLHCYDAVMKSKDWRLLTPDVMIVVTARGKQFRFALDAKYRRYETQSTRNRDERAKYPVDTVFELDLLGTAKMKYMNASGCDAAFVLHSDPDPRFTFWGSEPLPVNPHRERYFKQPYWPAHRFGAIHASPVQSQNLERLLRCLLMYHAKVEDVCWPCRYKLTVANGGITKNAEWVGDYYQCPDCGRFWIGTVCHGSEHHRLIKMGKDSFHKTKPGQDWQCICPACGDELKTAPIPF